MDPMRKATVTRVEAESPAARAGFRAGDELLSLDDQALLSIADIQWALHNAGEHRRLTASIQRGGQPMQLSIDLEPGWRRRGDISWRATSWDLRRMTTGGLRLKDMSDKQRAERSLAPDALALVVAHVGEYGEHAHAKQQGFMKDDVIVSIAGMSKRLSESELFALLVNKPAGERVPVTVLRGSERVDLSLVMQK
jgi:S1-C subfamily serine protease